MPILYGIVLRLTIACVIVGLEGATAVGAESSLATQVLVADVATAERCLGTHLSMVEELRLAQFAPGEDSGPSLTEFFDWLNAARSTPGVCTNEQAWSRARSFQTDVQPGLRAPYARGVAH